ncbi:hypothetical protein GCM10010390_87480 [Streptomyces mordarskii]|uniref:Uncharacterized protein n=1 Tax=Streptomyces mordarskii TaxID=1226758 RepID=A0ABP3PQ50_9ACTN
MAAQFRGGALPSAAGLGAAGETGVEAEGVQQPVDVHEAQIGGVAGLVVLAGAGEQGHGGER